MANALLYNSLMKQNEDPRVKLDEEVYEQFISIPLMNWDNTNWGIVLPMTQSCYDPSRELYVSFRNPS